MRKGFLFFIFLILFILLIPVLCYSEVITITAHVMKLNNPPTVPELVPVSNKTTYGTVLFDWTDSTDDENDEIYYFLKVGTTSGGADVANINTPDSNYSLSISSNGTYYWSVKACDNNDGVWGNCSAWSIEDSFTVAVSSGTGSGGSGGGSGGFIPQVDVNELIEKEIINVCSICEPNETCDGKYILTDGKICCFDNCIPKMKKEIFEKFTELLMDVKIFSDLRNNKETESSEFVDEEIGLKNYILDTKDTKVDLKVKIVKKLLNFKLKGYRLYFDYAISANKTIYQPFILFTFDPRLIPSVSQIKSNTDFIVINKSSIGLLLDSVSQDAQIFSFYVDLDKLPPESLWGTITKPEIYVKALDSCENVICDDFDPCTKDLCDNGQCTHIFICEEPKTSSVNIWPYIAFGILFIFAGFFTLYLLKRH